MADKKPRTTVEPVEEAKRRAAEEQKPQTRPEGADEADAPKANPVAGVRHSVGKWLRDNFPGHENAFIGGACGLLIVLLIYTIGLGKTLLIVLFLIAGIAIGQIFDGDPKILRAIKTFIESRNQ